MRGNSFKFQVSRPPRKPNLARRCGQASFKPHPKGFTLIEMLVVVGIFSVLAVVFVDVYLLALRAQKQTSQRQTVLTSLRTSLETMASTVRTGGIDYAQPWDSDGDPGVFGDETELYLVGQNGVKYHYYQQAGAIWVSADAGGSLQESPLTDDTVVRIDRLKFLIAPVTDPFSQDFCNENTDCLSYSGSPPNCTLCDAGTCGPTAQATGRCRCASDANCQVTQRCDTDQGICVAFDVQPHVTISLAFTSLGVKPQDQKTINLQTTITSRQYLR